MSIALMKNQLWKQIARARQATAAMALANGHQIYIVVPDWHQWPVAPFDATLSVRLAREG